MCPKCKKKINFYNNIPLLSFILLGGKCRNCRKKISIRYPLIEASTALVFLLIYLAYRNLVFRGGVLGVWKGIIGVTTLPYFLIVTACLIAIFVIDFEHQIIPDELVFFIFLLTTVVLFFGNYEKMYMYLFSSFAGALFLLLLNLITKGKGMGLGDVKLALIGGIFLSFKLVYLWFFLSFTIGAIVGLVLLAFKKAKFGKPIPFGPFIIAAFFIVLFWGEGLVRILLPF